MATVVVVDDDSDVIALITAVLTRAGHDVLSTTEPLRVQEMIRETLGTASERVVLVTDIFMPGHDGLELTEEVKRLHPEVGVIAISGGDRGGRGYLSAARAYGADLTLPKPFRPIELRTAVSELL